MELEIPFKKSNISKIAATLFNEKGYNATSMRDLASNLGIEAASIYSHVKSKEDILVDICFGMAELLFAQMASVSKLETNAAEKLQVAVKSHISIITNFQNEAGVFLHEWKSLTNGNLNDFKQLRIEYQNYFQILLEKGIEENLFEIEDVKFTTLTLLSTINWIYDWYKPNGKWTSEEISNLLVNNFINGIKKR